MTILGCLVLGRPELSDQLNGYLRRRDVAFIKLGVIKKEAKVFIIVRLHQLCAVQMALSLIPTGQTVVENVYSEKIESAAKIPAMVMRKFYA